MLLATDNALVTTGYTIFDDDNNIVTYGHWKIDSSQSMSERLDDFLQELEKMCAAYPIDKLAYEDIQLQQNGRGATTGNVVTFKHLAYLHGLIEYWADFFGIKNVTMSPSHWRGILSKRYGIKFGRKRNEQKANAQALVLQETGTKMTQDEADSWCIGMAAIINHEFEDKYRESAF